MTSPLSPVSNFVILPSPTLAQGICLLSPGISIAPYSQERPTFLTPQIWTSQCISVPQLSCPPKADVNNSSNSESASSSSTLSAQDMPRRTPSSEKGGIENCRLEFYDSMDSQVKDYKSQIKRLGLQMTRDCQGNKVCSLCREVLPNRSDSMHRHAPSHMRVKQPFSCCFCSQKFSRRDSLKRHFDHCQYVQKLTSSEAHVF